MNKNKLLKEFKYLIELYLNKYNYSSNSHIINLRNCLHYNTLEEMEDIFNIEFPFYWWCELSNNSFNEMSYDFIDYYGDKLHWYYIIRNPHIDERLIIKYINNITIADFISYKEFGLQKMSSKFKLLYGKYFV